MLLLLHLVVFAIVAALMVACWRLLLTWRRARRDARYWKGQAQRTLHEWREEQRVAHAWAEHAKQGDVALADEEADHAQTAALLAELEARHRRLYAVVARIHGPDWTRAVCEGTRGERASA